MVDREKQRQAAQTWKNHFQGAQVHWPCRVVPPDPDEGDRQDAVATGNETYRGTELDNSPARFILARPLQREMKRIAAQSLKELQDGRENEHQLEPIREDHGTFSPRLAFFGTRHGVFGHDRAVRTPASDKRCTSNKRPVDAASNPITQRLPPEEDRHLCGFVLLDVIVCRLSSEG